MKDARFSGRSLILAIVLTLLVLPTNASASKFKTLYTFTGGADGVGPSTLVLDAAGNLYGAAAGGGEFGYGTVFRIDSSGTFTVLYSFTGGADGATPHPFQQLILDTAGNLYGTTYGGGTYGAGTVFGLDTNGVETVLYSFCVDGYPCPDGSSPTGGVVFDRAGNLYGTTHTGGIYPYYWGVVFKLAPNPDGTWTETVLHDFPSYPGDAYVPWVGLTWDPTGTYLYGTTESGGPHTQGTIYRIDTNGVEELVYQFTGGGDGECPRSPVVFDSAGDLYVGTFNGGDWYCSPPGWGPIGCGTIVKLDTAGKLSVLHTFTGGNDGMVPIGGVAVDNRGNIYGTTTVGGASGYGTVFRLGPTSTGGLGYRVAALQNHPGAYPYSMLIMDAAGNLYGTTQGDGITTFGSVFEITP